MKAPSGRSILDREGASRQTDTGPGHSPPDSSTHFSTVIQYVCPTGHRLEAAENESGQSVRCPLCGHIAIVPRVEPKRSGEDAVSPAASPMNPATTNGGSLTRRSAGYRPDRGRAQTVRWLAAVLGLVVLFSTLPAVRHWDLETAPGWARLVLLVAVLETVYVAWMLVTPDWSTVWVLMLVFAVATAGYAAATAIAAATAPDAPMPLGMGGVRASAGRWCGSVLALHALATYLAGRMSVKWRRALELERATASAKLRSAGSVSRTTWK